MAEGTFFRVERQRGRPLSLHGRRITPVALTVRAGASWGEKAGIGFAWARPLAVEVEENGETRRLPVPDYTLRASLAFSLLTIALPALGNLMEKRRR